MVWSAYAEILKYFFQFAICLSYLALDGHIVKRLSDFVWWSVSLVGISGAYCTSVWA